MARKFCVAMKFVDDDDDDDVVAKIKSCNCFASGGIANITRKSNERHTCAGDRKKESASSRH